MKDIDAIRVALGQAQINYLGYSYGTLLGQVYGTLFPSHLRRAILDSNTDPQKSWFQANFDQDSAFQKVYWVFARWVAKYDRVYHLGKTQTPVEKAFTAAQKKLDQHPVGTVGGDEWQDILRVARPVQSVWSAVAKPASTWIRKHDKKVLKKAYVDFGYEPDENGFAVYTATQCNESQWPFYAIYRADSSQYSRVTPFVTSGNAW